MPKQKQPNKKEAVKRFIATGQENAALRAKLNEGLKEYKSLFNRARVMEAALIHLIRTGGFIFKKIDSLVINKEFINDVFENGTTLDMVAGKEKISFNVISKEEHERLSEVQHNTKPITPKDVRDGAST